MRREESRTSGAEKERVRARARACFIPQHAAQHTHSLTTTTTSSFTPATTNNHHRVDAAASGCQLDASLLYEVVADDVMALLLPINVMRNYAMVQARTRLVAMVDVDLLVSKSLSEWMEVKDK